MSRLPGGPHLRTPWERLWKRLAQWWRHQRLAVPRRLYAWWVLTATVTRLVWSSQWTAAEAAVRDVASEVILTDELRAGGERGGDGWRQALKNELRLLVTTPRVGEGFVRARRARERMPAGGSNRRRNLLVELAYYVYAVRGR